VASDAGRHNIAVMFLRRVAVVLRLRDPSTSLPPMHYELGAVAYQQADPMRQGELTREQAMAEIERRFPDLSRRQIAEALAQGLFESR
jgi:hypothetical protein